MKGTVRKASLSERVIALIESARQKVASAANLAQVYTNYEIGRQIVEEEQGGKRRAGYGEKILIGLSAKLTARTRGSIRGGALARPLIGLICAA